MNVAVALEAEVKVKVEVEADVKKTLRYRIRVFDRANFISAPEVADIAGNIY